MAIMSGISPDASSTLSFSNWFLRDHPVELDVEVLVQPALGLVQFRVPEIHVGRRAGVRVLLSRQLEGEPAEQHQDQQ